MRIRFSTAVLLAALIMAAAPWLASRGSEHGTESSRLAGRAGQSSNVPR